MKNDLVIGVHRPAYDATAKWTADRDEMLLKITDDGPRAIGIDPNAGNAAVDTAPTGGAEDAPEDKDAPPPEAAQGAPTPAACASLRDAAAAALAAWDDEANRATDIVAALDGPIGALCAALAGKPPRAPREHGALRKPREGTNQETVLALLRREEGATIAQICDAPGWQQHTVRGFFAGLKKRQGIDVRVLERVRQVGSNKEGARGSFTIYRVVN